jgi:desulfoferrodoxin-like iron-binding protein
LHGYHASPVKIIRIWEFERIMVNVSDEGQVFKCEICGNVVVVKEAGGGELVCCGEPMQLESE